MRAETVGTLHSWSLHFNETFAGGSIYAGNDLETDGWLRSRRARNHDGWSYSISIEAKQGFQGLIAWIRIRASDFTVEDGDGNTLRSRLKELEAILSVDLT